MPFRDVNPALALAEHDGTTRLLTAVQRTITRGDQQGDRHSGEGGAGYRWMSDILAVREQLGCDSSDSGYAVEVAIEGEYFEAMRDP
jgi:hypothetical protein